MAARTSGLATALAGRTLVYLVRHGCLAPAVALAHLPLPARSARTVTSHTGTPRMGMSARSARVGSRRHVYPWGQGKSTGNHASPADGQVGDSPPSARRGTRLAPGGGAVLARAMDTEANNDSQRDRPRHRNSRQRLQPDLVHRKCLNNALRLETYVQDAQRQADSELAEVFRKAQADSRKGAEVGKQMLRKRLSA